jgi:anthranilate synthase component 1
MNANSTDRSPQSPAVISLLSDVSTPVAAFQKLSQEEETAFLFESTEGDSRLARYSFVGVDPVKTFSFHGGKVVVRGHCDETPREMAVNNPLDFLRQTLEEARLGGLAGRPDLPFTGGLVGYLGYGATRCFENIPQQEADPFNVPVGYYGLYDSVVLFDHQYRRIKIISHRGLEHANDLLKRLAAPAVLSPLPDLENNISEHEVFDGVSGPFTQESFMALVDRSKQFIREGQVFQIVVSHRFSLGVSTSPLNVYRVMQALNPSPYAYLLKCPGFTYLGSSPETFVKCQDGQVVLRALAGTRPRGREEDEDAQLVQELRSDEKELAEHRMLVDLGRNDLGKVCSPGTVRVGEIATVTKYTHVMHLATEITGRLAPGKNCFDVFQGCFPRGTVSGAPKVRAMQLLAQLEPEQRGIYSGVVGYFDFSGNMDGAIAIRSALLKDGMAHVNAGAGIVFDSKPEAEYQETRNKARSAIKAIKLADRTPEFREGRRDDKPADNAGEDSEA